MWHDCQFALKDQLQYLMQINIQNNVSKIRNGIYIHLVTIYTHATGTIHTHTNVYKQHNEKDELHASMPSAA